MLADLTATSVVVEYRGRLARFRVEHLEAALAPQGRRVVVVEDGEVDDDPVRDVTEVLVFLCARRYGRGGARNRAEKAPAPYRERTRSGSSKSRFRSSRARPASAPSRMR